MAIARHGAGPVPAIRALVSQVHPVFMLPPVAVSLTGALLAARMEGTFAAVVAVLHALAIFAAVYTAHVKDGYVDFFVRGEDDDHPLSVSGCRVALVTAGAVFAGALAGLWSTAGPVAVALTAPTWALGYFHAPQLDTGPISATGGYPVGIGLALLGGYVAQGGQFGSTVLGLAGVLVVVLLGIKVIDDAQDLTYDRSIDKRTVAVVLGPARARQLAYALLAAGSGLIVVLAAIGVFPTGSVMAAFAFGAVAAISRRAGPRMATMLLIRGAYVLLALLLVALWYRPFSGPQLVDIGILGPYTYLATEAVFGTVALALLIRADALTRAVRTIAVLYPVAYVWDWYTLEVGVFAIELRTGIDLLGIPVEEHLFMIVVPALVLGIHETLTSMDGTLTDADR
ncbi:lycopene cyclase domain-containing protein [Halapricum desulfuricans]|uniref:1,4-dihydroxy-2-naphthoate octaprenyltransferase n=1 Tax=Halapricum desulfuricans TaxID=2841257 RepID=A0A897N4S8_9EURY|nr:1,4-dihydroxy-2-naphthoate octaprenyltransferase [Halapricum desulfuricans]